MKIGTLDWGIGGIDVHRRLIEARLARSALYLSDSGFRPYGRVPEEELAARVARVVEELRGQGCTHVVVGCNAASTALSHPAVRAAAAALDGLSGVIAPAVRATIALGAPQVTVLGGERTVASGAYARPLQAAGIAVRQRVAQPLSALIEAGELQGSALDACLDDVLGPVRDTRVLVLGCTHYAAVEGAIRARLPALERVVDPARETARFARRAWWATNTTIVDSRYWTTGDPGASGRSARAAWGLDVGFESRVLPAPPTSPA